MVYSIRWLPLLWRFNEVPSIWGLNLSRTLFGSPKMASSDSLLFFRFGLFLISSLDWEGSLWVFLRRMLCSVSMRLIMPINKIINHAKSLNYYYSPKQKICQFIIFHQFWKFTLTINVTIGICSPQRCHPYFLYSVLAGFRVIAYSHKSKAIKEVLM